MPSRRRFLLLLPSLAALAGSDGCAWLQHTFAWKQDEPQNLPQRAGLEQVIAAVNRHNSQIVSLRSDGATLKSPGYPTLRAKFAYQRPCFFRLKADAFGPEVDLGSNGQLFWYWIKQNRPPGIYYCRHEQFASSPARQMIPIEPSWLIEALGTLEIDPAGEHSGPYPDQGNRIQIRTMRNTPEGRAMKVTIIDAVSAWVLEQQIFDAAGKLRARSMAEGYHRDTKTGLYIPTAVTVECPDLRFSMRVDLGNAQVNEPLANSAELWTLPSIPGTPLVDLADPRTWPRGPAVAGGR